MGHDTKIDTLDEGDGWTIEIHSDDTGGRTLDEEIPEGVHVWTWHRRYTIGETPPAWATEAMHAGELERAIRREHGRHVKILPLYMYDHGGVRLSTGPFSCPWDSGQVGVIWTEGDTSSPRARYYSGVRLLRGVVENLDAVISGDVYGWIVRDPEGDNVESVWGYVCPRGDRAYMIDDARDNLRAVRKGRDAAARMERETFAL